MNRLLPLVLVASLASAGCLQSSTIVDVNGDGSGTIEQTTLLSPAALALLRQIASSSGKSGSDVNPFSEEDAKGLAARLGAGVSFVTSEPIKSDAGEGRRTIYAFKDINTVALSQEPPVPGMGASRDGGADKLDFRLARQANGDALLHVRFPAPKVPPGMAPPGGGNSSADAGQLALVKQMFSGLKISFAVRPAGTLVRTNSAFVENGTVTLLELDFDRLMAQPDALAKLQMLKSLGDGTSALKNVDGLKVNPTRDLDIEFRPGK